MQKGSRLFVLIGSLVMGCMVEGEFANAQSTGPAVFVANNGNCEGSVTSFTLNPDGTCNFVQKVVTGTVPCGSGQTHPGLNAQAIAISPNGKYLITGHGTISGTIEQLTFYRVNGDASFSVLFTTTTPDSPVDVGWIDDEYVAVTATPNGNDFVIVYKVNFETNTISQHYYQPVSYIFDFVIDYDHNLMHVRDGTSGVTVFRINADRTLTRINPTPIPTGVFFLGPGISPDGTKLYYGGGISSANGLSSRWIGGFNVDTVTGALTPMPNSPYLSPPADGTAGPSPKQVVVSSGGQYAFASHGGTAHIKGFRITPETGELTPLKDSYFDVGGQGDSGNMIVMGENLFVTRRYAGTGGNPPSGLISLTINSDGSLAQNGATFPTQGSLPWDIAVWPGKGQICAADISGDGEVNVTDMLALLGVWGPCAAPCPPQCPADINNDCVVNSNDLLALISAWGSCP